mgnify:CR=1 FL=1
MWLDGAFLVPEDAEAAAAPARLQRTRRNAFADVEFALSWRSAEAAHTDVYAAFNLNLWRDWMPPEVETLLLDKPLGYAGSQRLAPGVLVPHPVQDRTDAELRAAAEAAYPAVVAAVTTGAG